MATLVAASGGGGGGKETAAEPLEHRISLKNYFFL